MQIPQVLHLTLVMEFLTVQDFKLFYYFKFNTRSKLFLLALDQWDCEMRRCLERCKLIRGHVGDLR